MTAPDLQSPALNAPAQTISRRWESPTRYYLSFAQQDLFGHWELLKVWGAKGSARGGHQCSPMPDKPSCLSALDRLARKRASRGYHCVNLIPNPTHSAYPQGHPA